MCTNHLLHRWPDPTRLTDDRGSAGTAAFTYNRWRALDSQVARSSARDVTQVKDQLDTVRFTYPVPGVRTLWQAVYDLEDAAIDVAFFAGDRDGASLYTEPIRFQLTSDNKGRAVTATATANRDAHANPDVIAHSAHCDRLRAAG